LLTGIRGVVLRVTVSCNTFFKLVKVTYGDKRMIITKYEHIRTFSVVVVLVVVAVVVVVVVVV